MDRAVTIKLEPRPDGGLRVSSEDEPGLILSGDDPAKIMAAVLPALAALASHRAEQKHEG